MCFFLYVIVDCGSFGLVVGIVLIGGVEMKIVLGGNCVVDRE